MSVSSVWFLILAGGAITFATRLSFILLLGRKEIPPLLRRMLAYVPTAVLTAIFVPEVLAPAGRLDLSLGNSRLLAGLLAGAVAWRTKNIALTLAVGMAALWGWQRFL